jgi:hypothetical protein
MRVGELRPARRFRGVAAAGPQLDIGFAREALVHGRVVGKIEANDDLGISGHCMPGMMRSGEAGHS